MEIKGMVYASLFACLTVVGAYIAIPIGPVPITLQTFFVLLAGSVLGSYLGALSMLVYVLLGLIGIPAFAKGTSGIAHLIGPTGGYLIGFIVCAYVVGLFIEKRGKTFLNNIIAMTIGSAIIYIFGVGWLSFSLKINIEKAIFIGMVPFLVGDFLKLVAASYLSTRIDIEVRK
ncbi:MAG: biotin transporter BioY [Candidatus Hydrothermarchaeota archaeon]